MVASKLHYGLSCREHFIHLHCCGQKPNFSISETKTSSFTSIIPPYTAMNLSDEITVRVLKHLSQIELRQVRLVCKNIALLAAPLLVDHSPIAPSTMIGSETTQDLVGAIGSMSTGMARFYGTWLDGLNRIDPQKLSTPKPTFFSLPAELRVQIYEHLIPNRIHICPPQDVQEQSRTKPWALVSVSRQFREEVRAVTYPPTPIDIYLSELVETMAYETWIEGLHEGLEESIRHVGIDQFVDINWFPDGPVPERPHERRERLYYEYVTDNGNNCRLDELVAWELENSEFDIGDWAIRWLQHVDGKENIREDMLQDALYEMEKRTTGSSTAMVGLGKNGVRDLVASYPASRWERFPEGQYEGGYQEGYEEGYDGDYDGEYEEDQGENNGEEYEDYQGAEQGSAEGLEETPADRAPTPVQEAAVPQQPEPSTPATSSTQAPHTAPILELNKIEPPRGASADRAE